MNKVVVIGGDHHNTLGVIRGLGERSIKPELILVTPSRMTFVDYSRYVTRSRKIDGDNEIVDLLLGVYKNEQVKPVIICCSDSSSGVIDDNRDKLKPFFLLPGADEQGRISALMSKKRMAELAIEVGLDIPQTRYVKDPDRDLSQVKLPCIIKPLESRKGSKKEIAICKTLEDLKCYATSHEIRNDQIQDFIDKDFEYQLIGCSTKSEIIIPGVSCAHAKGQTQVIFTTRHW